jgi:hypothetical protein
MYLNISPEEREKKQKNLYSQLDLKKIDGTIFQTNYLEDKFNV